MAFRSLRTVGAAGQAAILLGLSNAAVSAYWLLGGTALLDTVGGDIERWGRERGPLVLIALAGVVLVKTAVGIVPLVDVGEPWKQRVQWAGLLAAWVLVVYGGLLTVVASWCNPMSSKQQRMPTPKRWLGIRTSGIPGSCCGVGR